METLHCKVTSDAPKLLFWTEIVKNDIYASIKTVKVLPPLSDSQKNRYDNISYLSQVEIYITT